MTAKNLKRLVIAQISHNVERIHLARVFWLSEEEVKVNLMPPDGVPIYSKTIMAPLELQIIGTFDVKSVCRNLKY